MDTTMTTPKKKTLDKKFGARCHVCRQLVAASEVWETVSAGWCVCFDCRSTRDAKAAK